MKRSVIDGIVELTIAILVLLFIIVSFAGSSQSKAENVSYEENPILTQIPERRG